MLDEIIDGIQERMIQSSYYYNELSYGRPRSDTTQSKVRGVLFSPKALLDIKTEKQIASNCTKVALWYRSPEPGELEDVPEGFIPVGFADNGVIYADPNSDDFLKQKMVHEIKVVSSCGDVAPYEGIKKEFGWIKADQKREIEGKDGLPDIEIAKYFAQFAYKYEKQAKTADEQIKVAMMANSAKYMLAESVYGEMKDLCDSKNVAVTEQLLDLSKQYRKDSEKLRLDQLIEKYERISVKVDEIRKLEKQIEDKKEANKIKKEMAERKRQGLIEERKAKRDSGKIKL